MSTTNSNLTTALNVVKLVSAKPILRSNHPLDLMLTGGRCGNCQELASIALMELRQQGLSPVDLWRFTNRDHVFVMIGRAKAMNATDPLLWGGDAVICDPWMGKAYAASDLFKFWPGAIPDLLYTFSRS